MKIECENEKIIIYLYELKLLIDNNDILNKQIKGIIVKIIKKFHVDIFGFSKVNIYHNELYGSILVIEKIYNSEYNNDLVDLKIVIHKNIDFYLEIRDSMYLTTNDFVIKNNKYYIKINQFDNIYKYLEYGKIIYIAI